MRLYHFTAAHLLKPILEEGLTQGVTPAQRGIDTVCITGTQWLTTRLNFEQDWYNPRRCKLPYDRTAFRLTIEIPLAHRFHLFTWEKFYLNHMLPHGLTRIPLAHDSESCNPDWWRVFVGNIHPLWIKNFHPNPEAFPRCETKKTAM